MSRNRSRARAVTVALAVAVAGCAALYVACNDFQGSPDNPIEAGSPDPRIDARPAVDAADVNVPEVAVAYCKTLDAALLCNEFPTPPVTLQWASIGNDAGGTVEWTAEAGATEPGAAVFSTGPFAGPGTTGRIYLSRGVPPPAAPPTYVRVELAVRFDQIPDTSGMAVVRFDTGTGTFYAYYSQLGYRLTHSYDTSVCAGCTSMDVEGTKPPIAPGTWDRLSITIEKNTDAGTGCHITLEAASGERIEADSPPAFTPDIASNAYLDVGFTLVNAGLKPRVFVVDDVSVSAR